MSNIASGQKKVAQARCSPTLNPATEGGSGGFILPGFNASPADKPRLAQWQGRQCGSPLTVSG